MKKPTLVVALLFAMTVPTLTGYAGPFDTLNTRVNAGQNYSAPYANPAALPGGKENPWGVEYEVQVYPGRIVGTWQKRGSDYYYVLPDGSDLKNNYVDNLYLSWTGRMIPENYVSENRFMYNSFYGGQAPWWAQMDGFKGSITSGLLYANLASNYNNYITEYKAGRWQTPAYAKEAFDWMDAQMPNIINLPEQERAIAIARLISANMNYDGSQLAPADAFQRRSGGFDAFIGLYNAFARRAGLTAREGGNGKRFDGQDWRWNTVTINGSLYNVDTITFKATQQDRYLLSPVLWEGYISRETLNAIDSERRAQDAVDPNLTNIPIGGVKDGGAF